MLGDWSEEVQNNDGQRKVEREPFVHARRLKKCFAPCKPLAVQHRNRTLLVKSFAPLPAFHMETIIKSVLAESSLQDKDKSTFIARLLTKIAGQSKADAAVLLDLALQLKLSVRTNMSSGQQSQTNNNSALSLAPCRMPTPRRRFHTVYSY